MNYDRRDVIRYINNEKERHIIKKMDKIPMHIIGSKLQNSFALIHT